MLRCSELEHARIHNRTCFSHVYTQYFLVAEMALVSAYPLIHAVTYFELCRELVDHDSTIRWCQGLKLLPSSKTCSCRRGMNLMKRKSSPEERVWRCPRKDCQKEVALRKGTFFEGTYKKRLNKYLPSTFFL